MPFTSMARRTLIAGFASLLCLALARADEFTATIVKVGDGQVTLSRGKGKKKQVLTLLADEKCRVVVARYDEKTKTIEAGDEIAEGLKNIRFTQLDKEPLEAFVRTNVKNDRVLEMRLFQATKKKK